VRQIIVILLSLFLNLVKIFNALKKIKLFRLTLKIPLKDLLHALITFSISVHFSLFVKISVVQMEFVLEVFAFVEMDLVEKIALKLVLNIAKKEFV